MKQFLRRLTAYLFFLVLLIGIFQAFPKPIRGPIETQIAYYVVIFAVPAIFWIGVCELFYRAFRTKKVFIMETQPLPPSPAPINIQDQPTAGIETQRLDREA